MQLYLEIIPTVGVYAVRYVHYKYTNYKENCQTTQTTIKTLHVLDPTYQRVDPHQERKQERKETWC